MSAVKLHTLYVSDVFSQQAYCVLDLICGCSLTRTMFLILFPDQLGSQTCESWRLGNTAATLHISFFAQHHTRTACNWTFQRKLRGGCSLWNVACTNLSLNPLCHQLCVCREDQHSRMQRDLLSQPYSSGSLYFLALTSLPTWALQRWKEMGELHITLFCNTWSYWNSQLHKLP